MSYDMRICDWISDVGSSYLGVVCVVSCLVVLRCVPPLSEQHLAGLLKVDDLLELLDDRVVGDDVFDAPRRHDCTQPHAGASVTADVAQRKSQKDRKSVGEGRSVS